MSGQLWRDWRPASPGQAPGSAGASLDEERTRGSSASLLVTPLSGFCQCL